MYARVSLICLIAVAMSAFAVAQVSPVGAIPPNVTTDQDMGPASIDSFGSVSGVVCTIDGRPLREVTVQLRDTMNGNIISSGTSRMNGSFDFYNVPPGHYEVVALKGVDEAHERVQVSNSQATATLRMAAPVSEPGAGNTVSVKALQIPGKARKEFQKAQEAFNKGKFEDSRKRVDKALEAFPQFAEALTLRGILRVNNKDYAGGQQDLQQAINDDSNYAMAFFALGATQNELGKFTDAQQTLEEGLRVDPTSWQGYFELSKSKLGQEDYRNALKYVVKAEDIGSGYAPIHLVKAHALLGLKAYDEAAVEFERFLNQDPKNPGAPEARQALSQARAFAAMASK